VKDIKIWAAERGKGKGKEGWESKKVKKGRKEEGKGLGGIGVRYFG